MSTTDSHRQRVNSATASHVRALSTRCPSFSSAGLTDFRPKDHGRPEGDRQGMQEGSGLGRGTSCIISEVSWEGVMGANRRPAQG